MSNPPVTVSCQGVTKSYGAVQALRGIDLQVREGEVYGFLGPNGAGKTTLIRCLLDMIRPDGGEIQVLGKNPQDESVAVRQATGYLPGELNLDPGLRAGEMLGLLQRLRSGREDKDRVGHLAERLGLDLNRRIKNLSKGNKQKIGVIQAFMHEPSFLLLDEPTSGLDPLVQQTVLQMVREAKERLATVFFSSHYLTETQHVADRVAMIRDGQIVMEEDTQALKSLGLTRLDVELERPVKRSILDAITGVTVVNEQEGKVWRLQVSGELDALLSALAGQGVRRFETLPVTLDEVFFQHYEGGEK